jgi:hypothetical protein
MAARHNNLHSTPEATLTVVRVALLAGHDLCGWVFWGPGEVGVCDGELTGAGAECALGARQRKSTGLRTHACITTAGCPHTTPQCAAAAAAAAATAADTMSRAGTTATDNRRRGYHSRGSARHEPDSVWHALTLYTNM